MLLVSQEGPDDAEGEEGVSEVEAGKAGQAAARKEAMSEQDIEALARAALEDAEKTTLPFELSVPWFEEQGGPMPRRDAARRNLEWFGAAREREPALAREVLRLRAWMRHFQGWTFGDWTQDDLEAGLREAFEPALRGDPAPEPAP